MSILLIAMGALYLGYRFYGRIFAKQLDLNDSNITPATKINDGIDYVPAKMPLLLGQHFSAIAAAGPIVGPILAGLWFGWLPAFLWLIIGAIFIGGVHDFYSLAASIRHKAASIGEIIKNYTPKSVHISFLIFVWLTLIYVIIAFTDITANTFKTTVQNEAFGPAVAASSIMYLLLAIVLGVLLYRFKLNLSLATIIFVPLVLFIVWYGPRCPQAILNALGSLSVKEWDMVLLGYCFAASVIPMWLLLQPRGYLGGWMLYAVIIVGFIGAFSGKFPAQYPAVNLDGIKSLANGKMLIPALFITIACGACSGFHGVVASGTSSKQLAKERDALPIGFGSMLLESLVGVLALITVMILPKGDALIGGDPNLIYANGIARYLGLVGIKFQLAFPFALLVFSTFVYDTLDVCTRLARYIFQELTGLKGMMGGFIAAVASLVLPLIFLMLTKEKGYLVAWPIFGSSNQLLAALTLLGISLWLIKTGKKAIYAIVPMIFMLVMTLWSLVNLIVPFAKSLPAIFKSEPVKIDIIIAGVCGIILLLLSLFVIKETIKSIMLKKAEVREPEMSVK
ncbi:MAG TPA: carbon starvation protein A [Phycisphaerales bacterium]|nr:carbon starvation protein A [Phycisphaerales bacterium]